jgi:predicted metalloprotease with PDZ domain
MREEARDMKEEPMKKTWLAAALVGAMALSATFAGEKYGKCKEDAQTCLNHMVAKMKDRGWLGIQMDDESGPTNIKITKVIPGSPAEGAGFKEGDVLVSVNGARFADNTEEKCATCDKTKDDWKPGSKVTYVVNRSGVETTLHATLAALPSDVMAQWVGMHMIEHASADTAIARTEEKPKP